MDDLSIMQQTGYVRDNRCCKCLSDIFSHMSIMFSVHAIHSSFNIELYSFDLEILEPKPTHPYNILFIILKLFELQCDKLKRVTYNCVSPTKWPRFFMQIIFSQWWMDRTHTMYYISGYRYKNHLHTVLFLLHICCLPGFNCFSNTTHYSIF